MLRTATSLYRREGLRRVYFGSYQPVEGTGSVLVDAASPAIRERRLYEADWLVRLYGFSVEALAPADAPDLALDALRPHTRDLKRHVLGGPRGGRPRQLDLFDAAA